MFESLKSWLDITVVRRPFLSYSGSGDKVYGDAIATVCYIDGSIKLVQNREGINVLSNVQLYIAGKHVINAQDTIVMEDTEYDIIAVHPFYRKGKKDMWVVYI
jgi:hypothetical protein